MRVIFAVDEPTARAMTGVLEELGHDALGFDDGERAWDAYRVAPSPLVVLDLKIPDTGALELCRRLRARDVWSPVLMLTARDAVDDRVAGLDAGADDYVSKPSTPASLRARIEIAERRLRETAALRTAEEDLARARWLAGIGETALTLEREIGGPLHTILDRSASLLDDASFPDEQREHRRVIMEQGARLAGVVGRAVNLQSPQTVEYLGGARMIDLSGEPGATDSRPQRRMHTEDEEHARTEEDDAR
jgi:CheY-like chemotaxis protein